GGADNVARHWDATTRKPIGPPLPHRRPVRAVAYSPDGSIILTTDGEGVRQWEATTGKPLGTPLPGQASAITFAPDGRRMLLGWTNGSARFWAVPEAMQGNPERLRLWAQVVTGMELDDYGALRVLDAKTWQERHRRLRAIANPKDNARQPPS
ncbi:MAG TPA: hypothetical protein VKD72_22010, partial [Gemmataceae bacterium]|nr:hypothetical protein [Gemmataceae bacterium]